MKRYLAPIVVVAVVATACGDGDTSTPATSAVAAAPTSTTGTTPAQTTMAVPSEASITTADGLTLEATVYPGGSAWVVLAHMRPADRTSWAGLAGLFHGAGYSVLAYNNRGYGGSEGDREAYSLQIDANAALEHARASGAESLVFGGASMNGATAMTLGASNDFAAIFVLSAVASFPSVPDAAAFLPEVTEPILFVAAGDDGNAVGDAEAFFAVAPDPHRIVLESGGHGTNMLSADPELGGRIVEWVNERLAISD